MIYYLEDVRKVYNLPLPALIYYAQEIHRQTQVPDAVQINMLQSIKTGACSEDCAYCPQSAREFRAETGAADGHGRGCRRREKSKSGGSVAFLHGRGVASRERRSAV